MTLKEIRDDILLIAQHSKVSKDSRFWDHHIDYLIHKYRSRLIHKTYQEEGLIDPVWIQDLGVKMLDVIDSSEDPSLGGCSATRLGKVVLPAVLPLKNHNGVVRVSGSSREKSYYQITVERFFDMDPSSLKAKMSYYFRVGNAFYLNPAPTEAHFALILDNPMEGFFYDNTIQREIKEGTKYRVSSGSIIYNGIRYTVNTVFSGVNSITSYSGAGIVYFDLMRRPMTDADQYPVTFNQAEFISNAILTRDLDLEYKRISDIKNDNADQVTLMQQAPGGNAQE